MEQFFEFIANHPFLVGLFVVLLILFIRNETSRGGTTISAQELVSMVNGDGALVLDVRDKAEFEAGHIVDAVNIPYSQLESRYEELNKHKDKPIVITCKMGQHSGTAGTLLRKHGFEQISRLRGGIADWRGQSLPLTKA